MIENEALTPKALKKILDLEHEALLSGNLDRIERLGEAKVKALERVIMLPSEIFEEFAYLQADLVRNQELAKTAIAGMHRGLARVQAIIDVKTKLKTYNSEGQKNHISMRSGQALSKRS